MHRRRDQSLGTSIFWWIFEGSFHIVNNLIFPLLRASCLVSGLREWQQLLRIIYARGPRCVCISEMGQLKALLNSRQRGEK